jgi:hypothetical protein
VASTLAFDLALLFASVVPRGRPALFRWVGSGARAVAVDGLVSGARAVAVDGLVSEGGSIGGLVSTAGAVDGLVSGAGAVDGVISDSIDGLVSGDA